LNVKIHQYEGLNQTIKVTSKEAWEETKLKFCEVMASA